MYPCIPQFYYIKVGYKGIVISRTCFPDDKFSDCKDSKYIYQPAGHIVTVSLKIILDSTIRDIVSKGPKYRFSSYINFDKCREEICIE